MRHYKFQEDPDWVRGPEDRRGTRKANGLGRVAAAPRMINRVPSCVSSTIGARRSLKVDLRTTSPRFSRRSIAAVMEQLASSTFS